MKWLITTSGEHWHQKANNSNEAVAIAFKRKPPKALGALVQIEPLVGATDDTTFYLSAEAALKLAGFEVGERRKP